MTLRAGHVSYSYDNPGKESTKALNQVNIEIFNGEVSVLLGPTGSGKSTLARLLAGLIQPSEGVVDLDNEPVSLGSVGLSFQNPHSQLFAESVLLDVTFGPKNLGSGDPLNDAREALRSCGLDPDEWGEISPFLLSGGQARRVALAGTIAAHPRYVLFDEPTAGLDRFGRKDILDTIRSLRAKGIGVLIITHDVDDLLDIADKVIFMCNGVITGTYTMSEISDNTEPFERAGLRPPEIVMYRRACKELLDLGGENQ